MCVSSAVALPEWILELVLRLTLLGTWHTKVVALS